MRVQRTTSTGAISSRKAAQSSRLCGAVSVSLECCFARCQLALKICSAHTVHLNEDDFPDPHTFKPERFTEKRDYPGPNGHSAFGWGRRICPGT